jgi:glycosyltransferase involved in cell wall biosynthesis
MLDLALAKHFARLLHPEIQSLAPAATPPDRAFQNWWLVKGRAAYPYWSYLTAAEIAELSKAAGTIQIGALEVQVPLAMQLALSLRPDVIEKFSQKKSPNTELGKADPRALAGWFFAMGIKEHLFQEIVGPEWVRELDRSVPLEVSDASTTNAEVPLPTVFMVLVWSLLEPELQMVMDLNKSASRYRFIAWFFTNAMELFQFSPLLSNRWKSWLQEGVYLGQGTESLPRYIVLEHSLMKAGLAPDLKTAAGIEKLRAYAAVQIEEKGKWAWLKQKSNQGATFPFARFDPTTSTAQQPAQAKRPFGLNLIGFAYGELGIGEDLRMAVAACEAAKIPYRIVNIKPGDEIRQEDLSLKERIESGLKDAQYAINVFIMPGFDTVARLFMRKGDRVFQGFYNIGWWPWELSIWPKAWDKAFEVVDEVWAGSAFSFEMYQRSTTKPSRQMPLAVSVERVKPYTRKHFKLPEKAFLFLYVFDFNSHIKRKNPEAAIAAFQQAFPSNQVNPRQPVGLVLKLMNTKLKDPQWLAFEKLCAADKRIHIMNKTLDRQEVLGLIQVCDAYVSPHRAEGFGRTIAEAMLLGKPVIATNHSGNQCFMHPAVTFPIKYTLTPLKKGDYHFIEDDDGATWANPSVEDTAKQMQAATVRAKDPVFLRQLKQYSEAVFAPARTGSLMKERLSEIGNQSSLL